MMETPLKSRLKGIFIEFSNLEDEEQCELFVNLWELSMEKLRKKKELKIYLVPK